MSPQAGKQLAQRKGEDPMTNELRTGEWQTIETSVGTFAYRPNYWAGSFTIAAGTWGNGHPEDLAPLTINGIEYDVTYTAGTTAAGEIELFNPRTWTIGIKRHAAGNPFGGDPTPAGRHQIIEALNAEVLPAIDAETVREAAQAGRDHNVANLRHQLEEATRAVENELARYEAGEPFASYVLTVRGERELKNMRH